MSASRWKRQCSQHQMPSTRHKRAKNPSDKIIKFRKTYVFSRKLTIALENMQLDLHIEYMHLASNLMEYIAI